MSEKPDSSVQMKLWMAKQTNLKEAARWQEFGEKVERERIIKLLEDNLAAAAPKPDIIALIKGESNGNV